jgi:predicted phage-related endonuclease
MTDRIQITSREQWLQLRKHDVTASVIGALFGLHPFTTPLALFHEKSGLEMPEETNVRMRRGTRLERAVAEEVQERRPDWKISPAGVYLRDPALRLGATPDFIIEGDPRGVGVLQTKVSTLKAFKKGWLRGDEVVPPFWISMQTLVEMMLYGASWGAAAVYIDDPWNDDCYICEIARHTEAEARIREAVEKFWLDVEFGVEPQVDYARDGELIAALHPTEIAGKTLDLSGDNYLPEILAERARLKDQITVAQERVIEIDNEIKTKVGDAEIATLSDWTISLRQQHRKAFEVKATSFRRLNVTDHRQKEGAEDGPY